MSASAVVFERAAPRNPAAIWGIHYPLLDHALKRLSLFGVLFLTVLPMLLLAPWYHASLAADAGALARMAWSERLPILLVPLTSLAGAVLLFLAIGDKNATLASLIADYCGGTNPLQHIG